MKLTERLRSVLHALAAASQGIRKLTWLSWLKHVLRPVQQSFRFDLGSLTRVRLYSAIGISGLVLVGASVFTVHHMNQTAPWVKVFSQDKYIGMVPNHPDILQKMQRISESYHMNLTLTPVHTTVYSSYDWRKVTTLPTSASAIMLNGRPIVYTKDAKSAQTVLDNVKRALIPDDVKDAHNAQFVGNVSIQSKIVSIADIMSQVAAMRYILNPSPDNMASRMGTVDSLLGMSGSNVSKVSTTKTMPLLQLATETTVTKTIRVPFHTKYVKDSRLGIGSVRVVTHGRSGLARETIQRKFVNGKLVGEVVIQKDVVESPVTQVAHRGTNDGIASGSWGWPTTMYDVTSPFGPRSLGGGFHPGEDIGCPIGTPVYATNNGTVEDAGWDSGGYGNWVKISNGNGIESVFGHMSRVVAHAGERVARGTLIGYSGDTGFVTGPHLHYEIRINGRAVNPSSYM